MRVDPTIERAEIVLHGHRMTFLIAGDGPAVALIHGVAGRAGQWRKVMELRPRSSTVVAPDLLGHGESAKPRGDYSLGAHATGIRDLLVALGLSAGVIAGGSLGGGVGNRV